MEENGDGGVEMVASEDDTGDDVNGEVVAVANANTSNSSDSNEAVEDATAAAADAKKKTENLTTKYHVDPPKQQPTLFSDERGNLKFVNLVVEKLNSLSIYHSSLLFFSRRKASTRLFLSLFSSFYLLLTLESKELSIAAIFLLQ